MGMPISCVGQAGEPLRAPRNWAALFKGRWKPALSFILHLSVPWPMLEGCSLPAARSAPSPAARPRWHPSTPKVREGSGKSRGRGLIYNLPVMVPRAPWGQHTPARLVLCTGCSGCPQASAPLFPPASPQPRATCVAHRWCTTRGPSTSSPRQRSCANAGSIS